MPRIVFLLPLVLLGACQMPFHRTVELPAPRSSSEPLPSADMRALEREIIDVVNRTRASHDARALAADDAMMRAARAHAEELAGRGELDHASSTPGHETFARRLAAAGAPAWTLAGENLVEVPYIHGGVADDAVTVWLGSPSHRSQMLEPSYTHTGVGVAQGAGGNVYVVQLFIRSR